ncbi:MAG: arginine deiminase family protein, partial [Malacoplasma sp.]
MFNSKGICVYSEISDLKKVLVHTPGEEINNISPSRLDELLFSAILEPKDTVSEHKKFISILEKEGVEVVQLVDLVTETYDKCSESEKNEFMDRFISEIEPIIKVSSLGKKIKEFLLSMSSTQKMVRKMMSGIFSSELGVSSKKELIVDPMPNLYFTRDPFASIGSGVSINKMKYITRRRETIFCDFIFSKNKDYKSTSQFYSRNDKCTIEGGDIFIYNEETLVVGVSERTQMNSI